MDAVECLMAIDTYLGMRNYDSIVTSLCAMKLMIGNELHVEVVVYNDVMITLCVERYALCVIRYALCIWIYIPHDVTIML